MTWFKIAERTGCTVQRAKRETTSTEFLMWERKFEEEINDFHRDDWFFAQICYRLYILQLSWSGGQAKLSPEDFLIKFKLEKKDLQKKTLHPKLSKPIEEMTEDEIIAEKERISQAEMAIFFPALGLDKNGQFVLPIENMKPMQNGPDLRTRPVK